MEGVIGLATAASCREGRGERGKALPKKILSHICFEFFFLVLSKKGARFDSIREREVSGLCLPLSLVARSSLFLSEV